MKIESSTTKLVNQATNLWAFESALYFFKMRIQIYQLSLSNCFVFVGQQFSPSWPVAAFNRLEGIQPLLLITISLGDSKICFDSNIIIISAYLYFCKLCSFMGFHVQFMAMAGIPTTPTSPSPQALSVPITSPTPHHIAFKKKRKKRKIPGGDPIY